MHRRFLAVCLAAAHFTNVAAEDSITAFSPEEERAIAALPAVPAGLNASYRLVDAIRRPCRGGLRAV